MATSKPVAIAADTPVTLFVNDGQLSVGKAKPFLLRAGLSIPDAASLCHQVLHGGPNEHARLFTDLGLDLTLVETASRKLFIPLNQPLVVSSGESFVAPFFPSQMLIDNPATTLALPAEDQHQHQHQHQQLGGYGHASMHAAATEARLLDIYGHSLKIQKQQHDLLQSLFVPSPDSTASLHSGGSGIDQSPHTQLSGGASGSSSSPAAQLLSPSQSQQQQQQPSPLLSPTSAEFTAITKSSADFLADLGPLMSKGFTSVLDEAFRNMYSNDPTVGPHQLPVHVSHAINDLQFSEQPGSSVSPVAPNPAASGSSMDALFNNMMLPTIEISTVTIGDLSKASFAEPVQERALAQSSRNRARQLARAREATAKSSTQPAFVADFMKAWSQEEKEEEESGNAGNDAYNNGSSDEDSSSSNNGNNNNNNNMYSDYSNDALGTKQSDAHSQPSPGGVFSLGVVSHSGRSGTAHLAGSSPMSGSDESSSTSRSGGSKASKAALSASLSAKERPASLKVNEQRARDRLRNSLQELILALPSLSDTKGLSRAAILQKAAEFLSQTRRRNETLRAENDRARHDIEQLQMEQQRLQQQIQAANLMTVEITDNNHRYVFVDHMWEIVTGYERHEALGKFVRDVAGCPTCPLMIQRGLEIMRNIEKGLEWRGLIMSRRKDGRIFASLAHIVPVLDEQKRVIQNVCTRRHFHLLNSSQAASVCMYEKSLENEVKSAIPLEVPAVTKMDDVFVTSPGGFNEQ